MKSANCPPKFNLLIIGASQNFEQTIKPSKARYSNLRAKYFSFNPLETMSAEVARITAVLESKRLCLRKLIKRIAELDTLKCTQLRGILPGPVEKRQIKKVSPITTVIAFHQNLENYNCFFQNFDLCC